MKKDMMHALLDRMTPATEAERERVQATQARSAKGGRKVKRGKSHAAGGEK